MEITSIKALINVISEGVIFVNQDKVVTHINHQAEELLRLIPGEIIGSVADRRRLMRRGDARQTPF